MRTLNFLGIVLRSYAEALEPHMPALLGAVFYLFRWVLDLLVRVRLCEGLCGKAAWRLRLQLQ